MITYRTDERLSYEEYAAFLLECDLGSQYPAKDMERRQRILVESVDVCVTARDPSGRLIGISFALTDWAYFVFLTDLGVVRDHVGQGIGRELVARTVAVVGAVEDLTVVTISHDDALGFYERLGMVPQSELVARYMQGW